MEEELANAGINPLENQVPPQGNKVPPQDQALLIPQPMTARKKRLEFVTSDECMSTQVLAVAIQAQAMAVPANRDVESRV